VLEKIRKFKPKLVCIVGMGVCRAFDKVVLDVWKPEELVREPVREAFCVEAKIGSLFTAGLRSISVT
jgi:hypothetical protein